MKAIRLNIPIIREHGTDIKIAATLKNDLPLGADLTESEGEVVIRAIEKNGQLGRSLASMGISYTSAFVPCAILKTLENISCRTIKDFNSIINSMPLQEEKRTKTVHFMLRVIALGAAEKVLHPIPLSLLDDRSLLFAKEVEEGDGFHSL